MRWIRVRAAEGGGELTVNIEQIRAYGQVPSKPGTRLGNAAISFTNGDVLEVVETVEHLEAMLGKPLRHVEST